MMDYQEFRKELIAQFEKQIYQLGLDVKLGFQDVMKNNGVSMDGFVLKGNSNVSPVVYVNQLHQEYENGTDVREMVRKILQDLERNPVIQSLDVDQCMNWERVKETVIFRVVGSEENQGYQEDYPCRHEEDLLLTYQVLLKVDEEGLASYAITDLIQKRMGVTEDELYRAAISNMPRLLPPFFENMNDTIEKMFFDQSLEETESLDIVLEKMQKEDGMYILSNAEKHYGAAVAFYPGVMDKIAQAFDRDMVVLPSSVHEMILLPYVPGVDLSDLKTMVAEINQTQVKPEEVLANQVYVYDKAEKKLIIGDEWGKRKLKKELQSKPSLKDSLKAKKEQVATTQPREKKAKSVDMEH